MKKLLVIYAVSIALAFGFSATAFAKSYTVKKGDSLYLIAKRHSLPLQNLIDANKQIKNPALIYPNQVITVPDTSTNMNTPTVKSDVPQQVSEVLRLVNEERAKQGLKSLTLSTALNKTALLKAQDMANKNYFSHQSPTYGSPFDMLKKYGISYKTAGENIAAGQKTPAEVMRSWLNSSGHRANILNANYTEIGIGYYKGGSYGVYWVQQFIGK